MSAEQIALEADVALKDYFVGEVSNEGDGVVIILECGQKFKLKVEEQ